MATSTVSATPKKNGKGAVRAAVESVARAAGENPERVRVINPEWATILADGFVIELTIESGSFETPLKLMTDYGIELKGEGLRMFNQYVRSHGTKLIFPKEEIREIERLKSEMRNLLIAYSNTTMILKHGRILPLGQAECDRCGEKNLKAKGEMSYAPLAAHTAKEHKGEEPLGKERGWWYLEWKGKFLPLIEQYYAERDRLVGKYKALYDQAIADAILFADDAYARLQRENNLPLGEDGNPIEQGVFMDNYVVRALQRRFPSREKMMRDFRVDWTRNFMPLASVLAADQAKAQSILAEVRSVEIAAQELAKAKTEVERDIIESRRAEIAKFEDFVSDMEASVRTTLYDATIDALAILDNRQGVLPSQTADRFTNIMKSMRALQFGIEDAELEAQMRKLRMAVAVAPRSERQFNATSSEVVFSNLEKVAAGLRLALIEIGRPPANRREKIVANGVEVEREYDPGARVGIPTTTKALAAMAEGRTRRVRGQGIEETPTLDIAGRESRRTRKATSSVA